MKYFVRYKQLIEEEVTVSVEAESEEDALYKARMLRDCEIEKVVEGDIVEIKNFKIFIPDCDL